MERKTTIERVELTLVSIQRTIEKSNKKSSSKNTLHLKNFSCSMLVRKHALSELQPLTATIAAIYHMGEKLTITTNAGDFNPKSRTFLRSGKVQTERTRLRASVEMSDKYRQLLKRGGSSCACLGVNHVVTTRDGFDSTPARRYDSVLRYDTRH